MEWIMEFAVRIAATLILTLIGVLGTYLTSVLGKRQELANINEAQQEVIRLAKLTVDELQQTLVDGMKAASADGKLTDAEIRQLNQRLIDQTMEKLSLPSYALLEAAAVDVSALITGAGESWIQRIKAA